MRQALQTLLRVVGRTFIVFLLLLVSWIPYIGLHLMVPPISWLDRLASAISPVSSVKGCTTAHSTTAYFLFLSPILSGCWAGLIDQMRQRQLTLMPLLRGWLGGWLGWFIAVWLIRFYAPFGYSFGYTGLWHCVLMGGPPLMPTGSYFLVLGMAALGATSLVALSRTAVLTFVLLTGVAFAGTTLNGFLVARTFKIAHALAKAPTPELWQLARYATHPGQFQRTAISRMGEELRKDPGQAGIIIPILRQVIESGDSEARRLVLQLLMGREIYVFLDASGARDPGTVPEGWRNRAEIAQVLISALEDSTLDENFRARIAWRLGWFSAPGTSEELRSVLSKAETERMRQALANALAMQGDREGLVVSLQVIKTQGVADGEFLRAIAEAGNEDLIAFVDRYVVNGTTLMHENLLQRGHRESIQPLLRRWLDFHSSDEFALMRLPQLTGSEAASIPFLIQALETEDVAVQRYALRLLRALSKAVPVTPAANEDWGVSDWKRWWQEHGEEVAPIPVRVRPSIQFDAEKVRRAITEVEGSPGTQ